MNLKQVHEIIKQIQSVSGRIDKENILKTNSDNQLLKDILYFTFNPYITTGLRSKKINKFKNAKPTKQFDNIIELFEYIKSNNTGTDEVVHNVKGFIQEQDEELQEFITEIVTKEIKMGATSTTFNKIFGKDFIPSFGCMLAKNYYDEIDKVKGEFYVTLKLDGHRGILIKENGAVSLFTRQGQSIDGLEQLLEEVKYLPDNTVFDGEMLLVNDKNLHSKDLYRETTKVLRKDGKKENVQLLVFDMLPLDEFKEGKSKDTYKYRRMRLELLFSELSLDWIKLLPVLYKGDDKDKVEVVLKQVVDKGLEGVMVNLSNGYYKTSRSNMLLKVKKFQTVDLRCLSIEEGEGKYKGKLGRINVEYKDGNIVGVGSGFTDEDRTFYFNNPEEIVNKIVEVQFFEESNNESGGVSLRFPVFLQVRNDKTEPSYY